MTWLADAPLLPCCVRYVSFFRTFTPLPFPPPPPHPLVYQSQCDPPASFNTVPCRRQPASGTCYRGVSPGLCEIRECTSGFQWQLGGTCNCFFVLGDMPVYLGEAANGRVRCGVRRDVPRFQLVRGDAENEANNCA